ncbi:NAD/NADP octopine/nopaline dehydrogenase family protein [Treponema sp. OMZ 798]|uniref:NAD/NADP octopine/nopaline dehydrogenase family protein n=1 Tax=Treponema sp. OMZ 798 TaxID=2563671 RepID=UPI0020A2AF18|nr:NAD/NADP octopine/nopaline dehydrogenase family protein [Treponema sp. OMZ 798]UTC80296.1 hypothetical protein E4O07_06275 [Treponema sp. OMZ 798]
MRQKLVIFGGGSSAHTLIPLLDDSDFDVSVLTSKPECWNDVVSLEYQNATGEIINTFSGRLTKASKNPEEIIPAADYIILCMPVHKYRFALNQIAKYINNKKTVFIGTIYGQGGFNWMVDEIKKKYSLTNIVTFAFGLIPWVCRVKNYGKNAVTYGSKAVNIATVFPDLYFEKLNNELFNNICYKWFKQGKVLQCKNFISLTLSVDNQIIHTSRCFGLYKVYGKTWKHKDDVPMFYRDYDKVSADTLSALDNDYTKIRKEIIKLYPKNDYTYMLDYLTLERLSYQSNNTDIKQSFVNSPTLTTIQTPVIQNHNGLWELDKEHRFFMDDIYYGVCIAKWIAEKLCITVKTIDEILYWAEIIRNEHIIDHKTNSLLSDRFDLSEKFKSGLPCYYGLNSIGDIID